MSRRFNATIAPKNSDNAKLKLTPNPRNAMELAFSRAAQKAAKPQPTPKPQEQKK